MWGLAVQVLGLWGHHSHPLHCSPSPLRVGSWGDPLAHSQRNLDRVVEPGWLHCCFKTLTRGETLGHCGSWNPERKRVNIKGLCPAPQRPPGPQG